MDIQRQDSSKRMSQIVSHNGVVYLSGQVGQDATADLQAQTRSVLEKIDALLAKGGSSREHLLSATIYLRDIKDFAAMNEIWDDWLPEGGAPARATVEARLARPNLLVEISVIAAADA